MKSLLTFTLLAAGLIAFAGCNTVKGVGRDIEGAGEAISGASDSTKRKIKE